MNGLTFLEPAFLWALASVIAIISIHFLKLPKTTTLNFSTLRFFDKGAISSYKAEKIRKWLLLLVRIAIFVLIVLLFANPSCKKDLLSFITNPQNELYIFVDPTPTMSYRIGNTTLGDSAMFIVDTIVKLRGDTKGIFVYNHKSNNFQMYSKNEFKTFYLKYYLEKQQISNAIENSIRNSKRPIFLTISDFQEESTKFFDALFSKSFLEKIPMIFVPLTPEHPSNVAIADINSDNITENRLYVKTFVEGKKSYIGNIATTFETIRIPAVRCTLSKDTTLTISLMQNRNSDWGNVTIDVKDPLTFDNMYYFTNSKKKKHYVLIIGEEKKNQPIGIALSSTDSNYWKIEYLLPEKITPQKWEEAELVIFNNSNTVTHKIIESYRNSSKKKKAYIYAISCDSKDSSYWREISKQFMFKGNVIENKEKSLSILLPDTLSELWNGFPYVESKEVKIYTFLNGLSGSPLLRLSNGQPLAVFQKDLRESFWFIIGTPIGISSCNNLCETAFYVPFLDRVCKYLLKAIDSTEEKWITGKEIKNRWYKKKNVQIMTIDNKLFSQLIENSFVIEEPGIYKIIPENEQPFLKAVVPDSSESRLRYRLPSFNKDFDKLRIVKSTSEMISYLRNQNSEKMQIILWLLLIFFIFAELYLRKDKSHFLKK